MLWLLLSKARLTGVLATEAIVAVVVGTAALCDARRADTGLIAAIIMGVTLANLPGIDLPKDRQFFRTIVQLVTGLLFISISATVTTASVRAVLGSTLLLVAGLVLVVRPVIAGFHAAHLLVPPRAGLHWLDGSPGHCGGLDCGHLRSTFVHGGDRWGRKLLPATFLVIVGTVSVYGLSATPVARLLGLVETIDEERVEPGSSRRT